MREMYWCNNACVLDVGEDFVGARENKKNMLRIWGKCAGALVSAFWMGGEDFLGTGDNEENVSRILGECARAMVPALWMCGGRFRGYGTQ